jgi:phosphatidylserine/phosphatidylglycerophosphate/cardiolipin synthase-like enzyme
MFLNVERRSGDLSAADIVIAKFQQRFRETQWPKGVRLPEVYFDPRSVEPHDASRSACLHAKFVVADSKQVFVSSANFTEAAQERNIEVGVFSENPRLAEELRVHFQTLIDHGYLRQARWH